MGSENTEILEGGCVCGALRYKANGVPKRVTVCHCDWCRQRTGTAFGAEAVYRESDVVFTDGPIKSYRQISDETGRWVDQHFCGTCGTNLGLSLEVAPGIRSLPTGSFDRRDWLDNGSVPVYHVFVRSACHWTDVSDAEKQFDGYFPDR